MISLLLFILFYIYAIFADSTHGKDRKYFLAISCIILTFIAGFKELSYWPDSGAYYASFILHTPSILEYEPMKHLCYSEWGFYLLGCVIKSITEDGQLYFFFVQIVVFFFLFNDFRKYSPYPTLAILVYVSRQFLGRNMCQIRAGLGYAIAIWGIQYVTKRDFKRFLCVVLLASTIHQSALSALPLYFMGCIKIKKYHIVLIIVAAFLIATFGEDILRTYITDVASDINATYYVTGDEVKMAMGLRNPVIYLQIALLFLYTFAEKYLKNITIHYYTIRNAYTLSTFILITFSMFYGISGRTASLFATLEFIIIPSLIKLFGNRYSFIGYTIMGAAVITIFWMNFGDHVLRLEARL